MLQTGGNKLFFIIRRVKLYVTVGSEQTASKGNEPRAATAASTAP